MLSLILLASLTFAAPKQIVSIHYEDGVNNVGDLRWYSVTSSYAAEDSAVTYSCSVDSEHNIGEAITLLTLGSFDPEEITASTVQINLAVGNKTYQIPDWYITYNIDFASLAKTTIGLTPKLGTENTIPISAEQIKLIVEANSIYIPTRNGTTIKITIPDSFASATRQTWMKCNQ